MVATCRSKGKIRGGVEKEGTCRVCAKYDRRNVPLLSPGRNFQTGLCGHKYDYAVRLKKGQHFAAYWAFFFQQPALAPPTFDELGKFDLIEYDVEHHFYGSGVGKGPFANASSDEYKRFVSELPQDLQRRVLDRSEPLPRDSIPPDMRHGKGKGKGKFEGKKGDR